MLRKSVWKCRSPLLERISILKTSIVKRASISEARDKEKSKSNVNVDEKRRFYAVLTKLQQLPASLYRHIECFKQVEIREFEMAENKLGSHMDTVSIAISGHSQTDVFKAKKEILRCLQVRYAIQTKKKQQTK
ncbi:hypothetical protein RFI_20551 [Reticulomyxa filosa]|uniref:Uncharacterized protein n=1 Tax=Reticulomyxa filosa TaxID=46433 RepID=X6MS08_RETFI|nr:hypothetical protein RFI_20551 [Reticulomyxa filosa]|eukprot:ETO16783.1 hypothetical protein RFI_20551 [Reticulomyxa filosa]